MDHLLILDEQESIGSLLQKVDAFNSSKVAIVAGGRQGALHNPVNMRLLQRKARDLALSVAIVSDDELTRRLSQQAGFVTYSTLEAFRGGAWSPAGSWFSLLLHSIPLDSSISRAAGAAIAAVLAVALLFVLPAASVTVVSAPKSLSLDVPVLADVQQNDVDSAKGRIPARVVSTEVEGDRVVRATGQRDAPDASAKGAVKFSNKTGEIVQVPKGTVVRAGSVSFATVLPATVGPTIKVGDSTLEGSAEVAVQAAEAGPQGNVRAGAITAIDGALAEKLTVVNAAPTAGGSNKKVSYLSGEDQAQVKEALRAKLVQDGVDRIRAQLARNLTFILSPQSQGDNAVEQLTYDQSPEQVTSETILHMRVLVRGLTFEGDDVNSVVTQSMAAAVRQNGAGQLINEPIKIDPPIVLANDGETARLRVHASGRIVSPLNLRAMADGIRGMDARSAEAHLDQLEGVGAANVRLWPFWVRKVPSLAWRIHAQVRNPAQLS